jgi:hypothetical protein
MRMKIEEISQYNRSVLVWCQHDYNRESVFMLVIKRQFLSVQTLNSKLRSHVSLTVCLQGETPYSLLQSHKNAAWIGKKVLDKVQEMYGSKRHNPCYKITRDKVSEPRAVYAK